MVVVVIETTFTNRNGTIADRSTDRGKVVVRVEAGRIMRVSSGREIDEGRMSNGQFLGASRCGKRLANANDRAGPTEPRAVDDCAPIAVERRVGEVRVTVDVRGQINGRRRCRGRAPVAAGPRPVRESSPWILHHDAATCAR